MGWARSPIAPQTVLFVAANPVDTDRRALGEQARAIQEALERAGRRDCFQFETRWAAQPLDLLREMVKQKPAVVHFCGGRLIGEANGIRPAGVYFQATDGRARLVSAKALADAFDAAGSVKVVVLDACYSDEHAAAVAAYVDCVVGMEGETVDSVAMSFAIGLYGGLGEGESVAAAFKQGCAAIGLTGVGDPGQPHLRVRRGVNASELVLTERRETSDRKRVDAYVERGEPLSAGGARQRGSQEVGNVTARDEIAVGASQANVNSGWPVYLVPTAVAAGLGIAAWRWFPAVAAPTDATVTDVRSLDGSATVAAPPGMVLLTRARIRPGVFDLARRPAECAALTAAEDCAVQREPADIPETALEDFYLDRYEVTNSDFAVWLNDHRDAWRRNALDPDVVETRTPPAVFLVRTGELCGLGFAGDLIGPREGHADQPANCMTWMAARDYCLAHPDHKRLPLDFEWELAAKGVEGRAFPWGDQRPHPDRVAFRRGGSTAAHPVQGGSSAQDVSPQGVYDLGGNVAEWVDETSSLDGIRTIRGGSWHSDDLCHLLSSGCKHIKAESFSRDVGFRCAKTSVINRKRK